MNRDWTRSVALSALVVLSVLAMVTPAAGAPADHAAVDRPEGVSLQTETTTITDCTVIDQSGSYELGSNLSSDGTCIEITASDVHLDGQGHTLDNTNTSAAGTGIEVNATNGRLSNVTITDVRLTSWAWSGFGNIGVAVRMDHVDDASITDLNVTGADRGLRLVNVTNSTITGNEITQANNRGVYMDQRSDNNTFTSNTIRQADNRGLLVHSSSNNTFEDNEIAGSGDDNVRLAFGSNWNTFVDNEISQSGYLEHCISVGTANSNLVFRHNTIDGCGGQGVSLSQSGENFSIVDNTVNGTNNHGIRVNRLSNATIANNTVSGAGGHGINVQRSANHTVVDNDVRENERFGINLNDVNTTAVRNNTVADNENGGLRLVSGSANNTVAGNTVLNYPRPGVVTFPTGIRLQSAEYNELRNNTVENSHIGIEVNESADDNTLVDNRVNNTEPALWTFVTTNSNGTTVDSLDIGPSTADNTTLSAGAYNVSISPNASAPANPDGTDIGRYVTVESMGDGAYVNLSVHYESGDVSGVNESLLALWTHNGTGWTEIDASAVNTRAMTVSANVTTASANTTNVSTVGVFATDGGESHAVELPSTPTPTATETPTDADPSSTDTGTTATAAPTDGQAAETTTGGSGPGFGVVAGVLALVGCALALRRQN